MVYMSYKFINAIEAYNYTFLSLGIFLLILRVFSACLSTQTYIFDSENDFVYRFYFLNFTFSFRSKKYGFYTIFIFLFLYYWFLKNSNSSSVCGLFVNDYFERVVIF